MVDRSDSSGQWLLLMAVIAGVGMTVLLVYVNQSVMAGYASSGSMLDFPKNDLREIRAETINEATVIGTSANTKGATILDKKNLFDADFKQYTDDLSRMYSMSGTHLVITYDEIPLSTLMIEKITLHIYYNNGETEYTENAVVYIK